MVVALAVAGSPRADLVAPPLDYRRANVERRVVNLTGRLEPFERVVLAARVAGYLKRIRVDLGDRVRAGAIVAEVDVPELEAEARMARAGLSRAKARLEQAEVVRSYKARIAARLHRLAWEHRGNVTAEEVAQADERLAAAAAEVAVRRAEVEAARARLESIQARLGFSHLRAPFDGIVSRRLLHTGALVTPAAGIVELVRVDRLRLVIEAPQRVAPYLRIGDPLKVRFQALPGQVFSSRLSRLSAVISAGKRRVEAVLPAAPGLVPGMVATVAVRLW